MNNSRFLTVFFSLIVAAGRLYGIDPVREQIRERIEVEDFLELSSHDRTPTRTLRTLTWMNVRNFYSQRANEIIANLTAEPPTFPNFQSTPEQTRAIQELVTQLGSNDFRVREFAHRKLIGVGPRAIELVRGAMNSTDREVHRRAEQILPILEANRQQRVDEYDIQNASFMEERVRLEDLLARLIAIEIRISLGNNFTRVTRIPADEVGNGLRGLAEVISNRLRRLRRRNNARSEREFYSGLLSNYRDLNSPVIQPLHNVDIEQQNEMRSPRNREPIPNHD